MKSLFILSAFFLIFVQCSNKIQVTSNSKPIKHEIWDGLLKKHVSDKGNVNYKGFIEDKETFNQYLDLLSDHHPNDKNWSEEEKLAYWINAYNAFTVKIVADNYPIESIKEIGGRIPFVNSTWDKKFIKIEGQSYDLNNLEHGILRVDFNEPRIHFAVNCASVSCPILRNEAYVAEKINDQLDNAAFLFINDPSKNKISPDNVKISKIFSWFQGDFTKSLGKGGVLEFISKYSETKINPTATVLHMDYDWGLNE